MKTILDKATRDELISRMHTLHKNSAPQWGRMNIYQMLRHCTLADEMYLGKKHYRRMLLGRLFGKMALRNMLKDDSPMPQNAPTSAHFIVAETTGDVEAEKTKWITLTEEYANFRGAGITHWFFGKMTSELVGHFVYKHTDHHLRQFNS